MTQYYYDEGNKAFYVDDVHTDIPESAKPVSYDEYVSLLASINESPETEYDKDYHVRAVKALRDKHRSGGVKVKVGKQSYWFHTDEVSLAKYQRIIQADVTATKWKTMDGSYVKLSPATAAAIIKAAVALDIASFDTAEEHLSKLSDGYDYSGKWPETYNED